MKRIGISFRTFGLMTLFLLYAILQIGHGIRTLVSKHTVSKTAKIEKVVCADTSTTVEYKKDVPLTVTAIKRPRYSGNAFIYLPGLLQN